MWHDDLIGHEAEGFDDDDEEEDDDNEDDEDDEDGYLNSVGMCFWF